MSFRHSRLVPFLSAAALVLVASAPRPVLAQRPIAVGQTTMGVLTPSSPVNAEGRRHALWTFAGTAGQSVRIDMVSGEIDSYLILQDAAGTELARNDDGGGGLNAQITQTLPVNGTCRILAVSFRTSGAMFGPYTLLVNAAGMAAAPKTPPPGQTPAPAVATPTPIQPPAGSAGGTATRIATGENHSCALVGEGTVMCWGRNDFGQLGDGSLTNRATPVPLNSGLLRPGLRFVELTAGFNHTCGLTTNGAAYCWGYNSSGQLGDGTTTNRSTPVAVLSP